MFPLPLQKGTFIELEAETPHGHVHCLSQVLSVEATGIRVSSLESLSHRRIDPDIGTEFRAGVITDAGNYGFLTSVLQMEAMNDGSLLLSLPSELYEWQRQYLRLDAAVWVRYRTIPRLEAAGSKERSKRAFAMTVNIGGGGLLLKSDHAISVGDLLELEIDIPILEEPILALGRVVHGHAGRGIEFVLIEETDRDAIIRYIFDTVRDARTSQAHVSDSSEERL